MSFFCMIKSQFNYKIQNYFPYLSKKFFSYRTFKNSVRIVSKKFKNFIYIRKRISLFTFQRNASVTIEASCIFPVFLSVCISMLFFIELFRLQIKVDEALFNTAKVYAQYMGLKSDDNLEKSIVDTGLEGIGRFSISKAIKDSVGDDFFETSFSFLQTSIDGEYIDIVVTYSVKFKMPFISFAEIPVVQRCKIHKWSGKEIDGADYENEKMVYITQTGSVYHLSRECSYIKLNILKCDLGNICDKRNSGGAKYYPCEKCIKENEKECQVYYTEDGTRYHNSLECSALKRSIYEVKLSDVKNSMKLCSKCGE